MTWMSSLGCVCYTAQISVARQKYQCCQIPCFLQRHYCHRVKPKSCTSAAVYAAQTWCSSSKQAEKAEEGRRNYIPAPMAQTLRKKKTTWFLTMTAADVNLGRSSADLQEIAAATAVLGSLRTLKCMQDVLGLHKIINYISLLTFIQS